MGGTEQQLRPEPGTPAGATGTARHPHGRLSRPCLGDRSRHLRSAAYRRSEHEPAPCRRATNPGDQPPPGTGAAAAAERPCHAPCSEGRDGHRHAGRAAIAVAGVLRTAEELCTEAARINNDGIAALVAGAPTRLIPFGTVPLPYPERAVAELRRCVEELGFKGAQILTNVAGHELSAPAFAPFWAEAERLAAAVLMHPPRFTPPDRLTRFYLNTAIG